MIGNVMFALLCMAILIFGHSHYQNKLAQTVAEANEEALLPSANVQEQEVPDSKTEDQDKVVALATNWPEAWQVKLEEALSEERPFSIILLGSPALGEGTNSWGELVKTELLSAYGERISVTTQKVSMTSAEFVLSEEYQAILDQAPDLLLWEPFTLMDNGVIEIEDSLATITEVLDAVKSSSPNTVVALQPPNPIYQAVFYPKQVEALKQYASDNGIVYFDHWTQWPDAQTDEILPYLSEDGDVPSEQGAKLWADYLLDVFVAE